MNEAKTTGGAEADGAFVTEAGVEWYRIDHYDLLEPFLISVVAPDDQWIYVSSSGALTAGRGSADQALFPYETDDRLHRNGGLTGPITIIRPTDGGSVWEPFVPWDTVGPLRRTLLKSATGDQLRFEEHNPVLGLIFRSTWQAAGPFGLVRQVELMTDRDDHEVTVELLDGLVDVLPAGVELSDQQAISTLVDGYRRSELDVESGLGLFTLEAKISDKADPAESLRANTIWTRGLDRPTVALSDRQVRTFRAGHKLEPEHLVTGRKGAFLISKTISVTSAASARWFFAADVAKDHSAVSMLQQRLLSATDLTVQVEEACVAATTALRSIVGAADGLQQTADRRATVHHFANTLFNSMRGGVFVDDHRVEVADVLRFVQRRNRPAAERLPALTNDLEPVVELADLRAAVEADPDLLRLVNEYLPLTFSRRHGDPSRPWNRFNIPASDPDGLPARGYEGNWRDIFQNWEALTHSFPGYIESVIAKFLNGSTLDGHNPYRITDRGLDWERPEAGSWGNFGYWGDHQIVYLHRLLAVAERFHPGLLTSKLDAAAFSFSDVPYRIVPYDELIADPKQTLVFDEAVQSAVDRRVAAIGDDGRLVPAARTDDADPTRRVHHATLAEKLLIPALAKLSNLVAGAGIWMNTQRPEWNDANNALVGNGISTVTLLHLRDYLSFVDDILAEAEEPVGIGEPVLRWLTDVEAAFVDQDPQIESGEFGDADRRVLLDRLGRAFEAYRTEVYNRGPGVTSMVAPARLREFLAAAAPHLEHAATVATRPDGLYHSYWLLRLEPGIATIETLPEMLEGQAAVLDSTTGDPRAAVTLVDDLFDSELYRPDQRSFILYPSHRPPPFLAKNLVQEALVGPAVEWLLGTGSGSSILGRDASGVVRFNPDLQSARHLRAGLDRVAAEAQSDSDGPPAGWRRDIEAVYEAVFNHRAFTGRSRTMYRYEGLGSIYWHMVSKLLVGVQDRFNQAVDEGMDEAALTALADRYHRIRSGLGFMKSVTEQGAFPTDPHSHTPAHCGAQQPGMTGQVKEGVLIRLAELGVRVEDGVVEFRPLLLNRDEFLVEPSSWSTPTGERELAAGTLGFTFCGVPIVYRLGDPEPSVQVTTLDGGTVRRNGVSSLDRETSRLLFARTGDVELIEIGLSDHDVRFGGRP